MSWFWRVYLSHVYDWRKARWTNWPKHVKHCIFWSVQIMWEISKWMAKFFIIRCSKLGCRDYFIKGKRSAAVFTHSFNFDTVDMHITGLLLIKPRGGLFCIFVISTVKYKYSYSLNNCKCWMAAGWHLTRVLPETSKMKNWNNEKTGVSITVTSLFSFSIIDAWEIFRIGGWQTTRSADH